MAPESGSGPNQTSESIPSDSRRFVARAQTLRSDPAGSKSFRAALERERKRWDAAFPHYPAKSLHPPPSAAPSDAAALPSPPALAAARAGGPRGGGYANHAVHAWRDLVLGLCAEWWPPAYYPNWSGPWSHPAMHFVAGCLVWDAEAVSEEWVKTLNYADLVRSVSADPTEHDYSPESAIFWGAAFRGLIEALAEDADRPGSPPEAAAAVRLAERAGMSRGAEALRAWQEARVEEARAKERHAFRFVRLFPGIRSTDWRAMEKIAISDDDRRGGPNPSLPEQARTLFVEKGMSKRKIAALLGVDRKTVANWLADD